MTTISTHVLKRIRGKGRGAVFTPTDFLDLGPRAAIDQALSRLAKRKVIRRVTRGLYDYPKMSARFGALSPDIDRVAQALARQSGARLQVSGARAANAFGLSTQVPAKAVYLTDGPSRKTKIGRQTLELRHAGPKSLVGAGKTSGAVVQALRYLGQDAIDEDVIDHLRRVLSDDDKNALRRDGLLAPGWVRPVIDQIAMAA